MSHGEQLYARFFFFFFSHELMTYVSQNLVSVIEQRETVACENKIRNEERVLDVRDVVARVDVEDVLHTLVSFVLRLSRYCLMSFHNRYTSRFTYPPTHTRGKATDL